jgi:hypothetical protein
VASWLTSSLVGSGLVETSATGICHDVDNETKHIYIYVRKQLAASTVCWDRSGGGGSIRCDPK